MMTADEMHKLDAWLSGCERPLLFSHRRPDGDALGALAALALVLEQRGLRPAAVLYEPLPARYDLLASAVDWQQWPAREAALRAEADALIVLDTSSYQQLEPVAEYVRSGPRTLVIDHHVTGDDVGTRPEDLRVCDPSAGAVCLLLAEMVEGWGVQVSPPVATALFVGLAMDTGWFRFSNVDARLLNAAARMVAAGAVANESYRALHEREPAAKLRLVGRMLERMELEAGGRLVVLKLRQADFDAVGADRTMTEDLVNEAGRLAGVEAMILFTEEPDGSVRVNLRSKETLDVAALAGRFNGGGHQRAAGARPAGSWDEVVAAVTRAATKGVTK